MNATDPPRPVPRYLTAVEDGSARLRRVIARYRKPPRPWLVRQSARASHRLLSEIERLVHEARKRARNRGRDLIPCPVFLVGVQRSGTTILVETLGRSLDIRLYDEDNPLAFDNFRIRDHATLSRLVAGAGCPVVVFKPICDSQHVLRLLGEHPGARAIWLYRRHEDAVNSATRKWGPHAKKRIEAMLAGDLRTAGWWAENLSEGAWSLYRTLYRPDFSPAAAYTLRWYVRNGLVFDLELDRREDVLLVNYERLVREPGTEFARIFAFMGCPFDPGLAADIHAESVGKERTPDAPADLQARCRERYAQLEQAEAKTR